MIVICGCSWGVGEWSESGAISGPGIVQYFSFWDPLLSLAQPGSSNLKQAQRLEEFLSRYTPAADDVCYWITTEVSRDITDIGASPIKTFDTTLHQFLSQANQLGQRIRIELIGGLCDLNQVDITPYNNLSIAMPSWCSILEPGYPASIYDDIPYELAVQATTLQQKTELAWIIQQGQKKTKSFEKMNYFQANHPDSAAHIILRNYLKPEWATIN